MSDWLANPDDHQRKLVREIQQAAAMFEERVGRPATVALLPTSLHGEMGNPATLCGMRVIARDDIPCGVFYVGGQALLDAWGRFQTSQKWDAGLTA